MNEVSVSRDPRLPSVAAGLTALVAAAYFVRAAGSGGALDWAICVALTLLTVVHVRAIRDSRTPLLVVDGQGVRLRVGRVWRGAPWGALEEVEHLPRRGHLRDGRLVLFPADPEALTDGLGRRGLWALALNARLHRARFAFPLGLTTRVDGAEHGLTEALTDLAGDRCPIVEVQPDLADATQPETAASEVAEVAEPAQTEDTVEAVVVREPMLDDQPLEDQKSGSYATTTMVVEGLADLPLVDPVIGPVLRSARERLRLSIDQLAERTRIRPHVLEALEIDDFSACSGDFYARGHLRTLGRVLGVDAEPLLAIYDQRYADAPVDPRRVFESDLAARRGHQERSRPGASVLVAAVMATVLVWSVARLLMDAPVTVAPVTPSLADGSAGLAGAATLAAPVEVTLTAAGGGAHVVVRDGSGAVVFKDSIPFGATQALKVRPPVRVQSSDGSLEVVVDGRSHGAMGETGRTAQDLYTAR